VLIPAKAGIMGWTFPLASLRQASSQGPSMTHRGRMGMAHGRDQRDRH
jgi:hypothetical protein